MAFASVARKSEIPDDRGLLVEVRGHRIALFNVNGTVHAISNGCIHRGGPLNEGPFDGRMVTCPWHLWRFDVTTGESEINPEARVQCFQVKVQGDDVLVEIG